MEQQTKQYPVVEVTIPHPSFSWANGRYIVVGEESETAYRLCSLDENKKPTLFDDGRFMEGVTNKSNCTPTGEMIEVTTPTKKSFGEMWDSLTDEQREYFKDYIDRQREEAVESYKRKLITKM